LENKLAGFELRAFAPIGILELWNDGAVGEFFFFTLFRTRV